MATGLPIKNSEEPFFFLDAARGLTRGSALAPKRRGGLDTKEAKPLIGYYYISVNILQAEPG